MVENKVLTNGFQVNEVPWGIYIKQKKNQVFKLLPLREEQGDWNKQLDTVLIEIGGLKTLTDNKDYTAITIQSKLAGLKEISNDDFYLYRKTVFEVINLLEEW